METKIRIFFFIAVIVYSFLEKGLKKVIKELPDIKIDNDSLNLIASISNGDYRFAINLLEIAYYAGNKVITKELIKSVNNKAANSMDENETGHYDVLSAF